MQPASQSQRRAKGADTIPTARTVLLINEGGGGYEAMEKNRGDSVDAKRRTWLGISRTPGANGVRKSAEDVRVHDFLIKGWDAQFLMDFTIWHANTGWW